MASPGTSPKRKPSLRLPWTHEEDVILTTLVRIHGPVKWDKIATHIHGRSGKSCRIRWLNQLNPDVDKRPFSLEEKRRLMLLQKEFGNKWSTIVNYFPGRTDNQLKNQYHILAGTRYKRATGSSSHNDPHPDDGFRGLSLNQNTSMAPVGSDVSDVTSRGTKSPGFAPLFNATPKMNPPFVPGSSSVYGKCGTPTQIGASSSTLSSLGPRPHKKPSYEGSMISDANSAGIYCHQFIDFFGVGN